MASKKAYAIIMAGGKATRLGLPIEKPLLKLRGAPLVDWVINAVRSSSRIQDLIVATSPHTKKTTAYLKSKNVKVVKTPGKGYVHDMQLAVRKYHPHSVAVIISADIPFLTSKILDRAVDRFCTKCEKETLVLVARLDAYRRFGISPYYTMRTKLGDVSPIGVNIVDVNAVLTKESLTEDYCLIEEDEAVVININTLRDISLAERVLSALKV